MLVKICGINDKDFLKQAGDLSFDLAGFIFYPKSPRYIIDNLLPDELQALPLEIKKVGVFVNEEIDTVLTMAKRYHLDFIQLHGNESPEYVKKLAQEYSIIKAFRVGEEFDFSDTLPYQTSCKFFLFDTLSKKYGGSGLKFDWKLLDSYTGDTPFLLSGGIDHEDAEKIQSITHTKFAGIDINSKFEIAHGIKDMALIRNFLNQLS